MSALRVGNAGVVHQDRHGAQRPLHILNHVEQILRVGGIEPERRTLAAKRLDLFLELRQALHPSTGEGDFHPAFSQHQGEAPPQPRSSAGDERHLA